MTKFSANLGFLWNDLPLPDAIRAAKKAGFHAVECHWPYDTDATQTKAALDDTGLKMLGINTRRGNSEKGENGLTALPDRVEEARAAIDEAIEYAVAIEAGAIHAMAGFASGAQAHKTFVSNLKYATAKAAPHGIQILIEPLNRYDAPNYFLSNTDQAKAIIEEVSSPNLALMFDCYHVQLIEGDLSNRLTKLLPIIGHIQFASAPDRGTPDHGEINFSHIFKHLLALGYTKPLGAEYKRQGPTEDSLGWLDLYR